MRAEHLQLKPCPAVAGSYNLSLFFPKKREVIKEAEKMKLMTTGNTESRMKRVVDTLGTFSKTCADYLVQDWGVISNPTSFGELFVRTEKGIPGNPHGLSERAMIQLSERLGAGNFLPELTDWHKKSGNVQTKDTLRALWNFNVNSLKRLHSGPLLFRTNSVPGSGRGTVRAVLSNQYVVLNNYELLLSTLEQVKTEAFKNEVPLENIKFDYEMNDELSDVRFYFINDHIRFDNDYRGGVVVKNGECGDSSFDVQLILFNTACANVIRTQIHFGMRHSAERVFRYSDLTNRIQAELVYRKAGEMTKVLFNRSQLETVLQQADFVQR